MNPNKNIPEDVWKRIDKKSDNECWEWMGPITGRGYGSISIDCKECAVHRLVYELIIGFIPNGLCVLHHCDNKKCCNPSHLWLGTNQDNVNDRDNKQRQCLGEKNGQAKLNQNDVRDIRRIYDGKINTFTILGKKYGVHISTIKSIIYRTNWKHI